MDAYACAKLHEQSFTSIYKQITTHLGPRINYQPAYLAFPAPPSKSPPMITASKHPTKQNLTIEQMREQNICFKCHEIFFPGH